MAAANKLAADKSIPIDDICVLDQCAADLSRILPTLEGDAQEYFRRLNELAVNVLAECRR